MYHYMNENQPCFSRQEAINPEAFPAYNSALVTIVEDHDASQVAIITRRDCQRYASANYGSTHRGTRLANALLRSDFNSAIMQESLYRRPGYGHGIYAHMAELLLQEVTEKQIFIAQINDAALEILGDMCADLYVYDDHGLQLPKGHPE